MESRTVRHRRFAAAAAAERVRIPSPVLVFGEV